MMRKNRCRLTTAIISLLLVTLLAGCKGTTITTGPKGAAFEFKQLAENDTEETTAQFLFDDGILTVELESGTANVEICRIFEPEDDDLPGSYTELETLYEATGLKDGDEVEVSGVRGYVVMRLWGNGKNGKVKFSAKK